MFRAVLVAFLALWIVVPAAAAVLCVTNLSVLEDQRSPADSREHQSPMNLWDNLRFKTGWIRIGILTSSGEWAGREPASEIIGKRRPEGRVPLPAVGDRIQLTLSGATLWILDFRMSGEQHRLVSPTTRTRSESSDETGLTLPPGAIIKVDNVQIEKPAAG